MRTIPFELEGRFTSLVAPKDAAAYMVVPDYENSKCTIFFRMKKRSEATFGNAHANACKETSSDRWRNVSMSPWIERTGGIPDEDDPYYKLELKRSKKGAWFLLTGPELTEYRMSQGDLSSTGVPLPASNKTSLEEIGAGIKILAAGSRW